MHPRISLPRLFSGAVIFSLLAFAGCSSDRGRGRPRPITPMAGQEVFFDGKILAKINVGNEGMPRSGPGGEADRGGGGRRSGHGGGRPPRGGGGLGGGGLGGGGGFGGSPGGENRDSDSPAPVRLAAAGNPVLIRVSFTNQSNETVDLFINDFASPLGNFAVTPEKLTLPAGQTLEIEPMTSQLGGTYVEVDAMLALRIGEKAEKKIFHLGPVAKPPAP